MATITLAQAKQLTPKIYAIYQKANLVFQKIEDAKESPLVVTTLGREKLVQVDAAKAEFQAVLATLKDFADTGLIDGVLPTLDQLGRVLSLLDTTSRNYQQLVSEWNDTLISNKINKFVASGVDEAFRLMTSLRSTINSVTGTGIDFIRYLPWILGVIFLGPPLIRLIRAGRKGGTEAFLTETESTLQAGGESIKRGAIEAARAARQAAAQAAKAAAAIETGGASLAIPGMSGVRVYRRKR